MHRAGVGGEQDGFDCGEGMSRGGRRYVCLIVLFIGLGWMVAD